MSLLEERLSEGLRSLAETAPEARGDLAHVKKVGRRRVVLGRAGVAAAAAALVIVAIGSVALVRADQPAVDVTGTEVAPSVTSTAPAVSNQTVGVTVSGVSGHGGHELAGVLYAGELSDLDREALGGFWAVIESDDYTTTVVVRRPGVPGVGPFPFVSAEALTVELGTYTLVIWVDVGLGAASRWVPINTDGQGLFGCQAVFEVGSDNQTDVVVAANLEPDGWNIDCAAA